MRRDMLDYKGALSDSMKQEMLLNIVRLRYMDLPQRLRVQQILAGYSLETEVNAGWSGSDGWEAGVGGTFTDRPTITYVPLSDAESSKRFVQPIPPHAVFYLIEAGFPADLVLTLCLRAVNGLQNSFGTQSERANADPEFLRVTALLLRLQRKGVLGMRLERGSEANGDAAVLFFRSHAADAEGQEAIDEVRRLLGLDQDREAFQVRYGNEPPDGASVVVLTRSVFGVMFELATQIDVPPDHAAKGWTFPAIAASPEAPGPVMHVHAGSDEPRESFVRAQYEGQWFWIRNDDLAAKRTFSFVRLMFSFMETGAEAPPTLLAVPG